jgi:hypothetical protein
MMRTNIDRQRAGRLANIILCGLCMCNTALVNAAGAVGINYGQHSSHSSNQYHHPQRHSEHKAQYGAAGNVQYSPASRYKISTHIHNQYCSHSLHPNHSSPAKRYYNQQYPQSYFDTRFPQTYLNQGYVSRSYAPAYTVSAYYSENSWDLLARGQIRLARNQFAADAETYPKAAIPKLGYALSSAASGKTHQSVDAMRRAFAIDSESLRYYRFDQRFYPMISQLRSKYQTSLNRHNRQKDTAFLLASFSFLSGDNITAVNAIERAKRDGDRSRSAKYLEEFIYELQLSTLSAEKYSSGRSLHGR